MIAFGVNEPDERDRFTTMVKTLDRVFLDHSHAKMKADRDKQKRGRKPMKGKRRPR
jgi:hypothetical protein